MARHDFGPALRDHRRDRRMSQMDLALEAGVSPRHLSFLESGRARPSRGMVLTLGDALDLPAASVNRLLIAAEFSPVYSETALDADAARPLRAAVDWMLDHHMPYPAIAVDADWCLVGLNPMAALLFGQLGLGHGDSLVDMMLGDGVGPALFENWEQVAAATVRRLRTESAHQGGNPHLDRLAARFPPAKGHRSPTCRSFLRASEWVTRWRAFSPRSPSSAPPTTWCCPPCAWSCSFPPTTGPEGCSSDTARTLSDTGGKH